MMTVADILQTCARAGIELQSDPAGRIRFRPVDRMTPDLADAIKTHKADLIRVLAVMLAVDGRIVQTPIKAEYCIPLPGEPEATPGVTAGWSRESWIGNLQRLADRCELPTPSGRRNSENGLTPHLNGIE